MVVTSSQHAYMKGRSTESALHSLVAVVEKGLEFKEYSPGVFLDIDGAFNNVATGINNAAFLWIDSLLRCSNIKAEWNEGGGYQESGEEDATRRSPLSASLATSNKQNAEDVIRITLPLL